MRRSERLARAVAAACLSTAVALALHLAGGAPMPTAAGVALPFVVALAVAAQLGSVPLSRWRLATAVTLAQVAFHAAFTWGAGTSVAVAATGGSHAAHDPRGLSLAASGDGVVAHAAHLTPSMLAAHLLAAAATYAVLRHADLMVEGARAWARSLVGSLAARATTLVAPEFSPVAVGRPPAASAPRFAHAHGVRGPPLALI